MEDYDGISPGQVLADASVAEFIKSLGLGIAEAQKALDENSVDQIAEFIEPREGLGGRSLLDLGLSPAFYHYQHADITCSLQLSLRVEKDLSLGLNLNGSFNDTTTESDGSSTSSTSSSSGTSSRTQSRQANVQITSSSSGALVVGGQNFALNGNTPQERIQNLQDAVTGDSNTNVSRVLYQLEASELTISTDAADTEVRTTTNTVAFLSGGFDRGIIRVGTNANTQYQLDDSPSVVTATTTAQTDLSAYALHVKTQIEAKGYDVVHLPPTGPLTRLHFETGRHEVAPASYPSLMYFSRAIIAMSLPVTVEGFADQQQYANNRADAQGRTPNQRLGDNRAKEVIKILKANGVPDALITMTDSGGESAAATAGDPVGRDNRAFRKVEIKTPNRAVHWLVVKSTSGGANLNAVTPNKIGDTSTDNGFIHLYKPTPLSLAGKKVTIEGTDFPFDGAGIAGFAANAPEAYARNLADDINGNTTINLQASATANVVTISRDGDNFQLILVTSSSRQISLSGSSGVTVTTQFSRSTTSNATRQNTGNRTVAVGASLDVRYSRQFEMNVTGNSTISARLVSIPSPPEFLETIKEFLRTDGDS
ncbi:MAG: hypothetical protein COB04_05100 [Gammaproteobacteria bacterium]|nr:MAG: hypothetical protein COB04_05100 [Gammaproteobacteria bacterium]